MKILVIGGMHGNELLGIDLVKCIKEKPIPNVQVFLANQKAIEASTRFIKKDLNRSFPGNIKESYEDIRAYELIKISKKYDLVLDFHNTYCPDNDCGFVGQDSDKKLYDIAWLLDLDKIIIADYDCMNKYASNCLSIEISLKSDLYNTQLWYERIKMLSKLDELKVTPKISKYSFIYRITNEDRDIYSLRQLNLKAFQPLPKTLAKKMNQKTPVYPIFIDDKFTPYYYGGLLTKIS